MAHDILKMNVKTLDGRRPLSIAKTKAHFGSVYNGLFDKNNRFMGFVVLVGNSKQRRQQRRALIKELNQGE